MKTFLRKNDDTMVMLNKMIKEEQDGVNMITLKGLTDAMDNAASHYGSDEIESLWTIVENNIDLSQYEKTAANGLKVYNMIYLYVRAVILRDITLTQFKVACEMATTRKCKDWITRCRKMRRRDRDDMLSVYRNVVTKMENDREKKYIKVGEYLERVLVNRSAVLIHHHPIGRSVEIIYKESIVYHSIGRAYSSRSFSSSLNPKKKEDSLG